jgi:hypothetical protein
MASTDQRWTASELTALVIAATLLVGCGADEGSDGNGRGRGGSGDNGEDPTEDPSADPTDPDMDPTTAGPAKPTTVNEDACGGQCFSSGVGDGTDTPFDPDANESENVGLDPEGALILKQNPGAGSNYIWIANTAENTVSKINVETYAEEGRYMLVTGEMAPDGAAYGADPSRTSVNGQGDAFVGSRGGHGLTRISSLGKDCPDTNGDGTITTSTGPMDVLPYGQDDCVLWFTKLEGTIRGVAAQDIPGTTTVEPIPDSPPKITTTPDEHYVWVGNTESQLWKIDAETGQILFLMAAPTQIYGLAMNGTGILYMTAGYYGALIGFVDTAQCVDAATCSVAPCTSTCTPGACPATCDGAAIGRLDLGTPGDGNAYGITVDCKQRVWLAGYQHAIRRYDPSLPDAQRLAVTPDTSKLSHGIGADRSGWVWGAHMGVGLVRVNAETLETTTIALPAGAKGIGIDRLGKVWGVAYGPTTHVVQPGAAIADAPVVGSVTGLATPYTYSDMTGEQLRLASSEPGHYRQLFEGCEGQGKTSETTWGDLEWDVDVPAGTWVVFVARTADSLADLEMATWFEVAAAPGHTSPLEIQPFIDGAGQTAGRYVEIEVRLFTTDDGAAANRCADAGEGLTPRVKSFALGFECEVGIE